MEDNKFIQMFLYSLVDLLCFLLSVVFLTALSNVRSQYDILDLDEIDEYKSYKNSYAAIAVLFSFCFFGFIVFMTILMIIVKQYKINQIEKERFINLWKEGNITEKTITVPVRQDKKEEEKLLQNYMQISVEKFTLIPSHEISMEIIRKIMLFLFLYTQLIYFIELVTLSVYHSKSVDFEDDDKDTFHYFTRIYRDLIIVGYIFFVLFLLFDLYTLILVANCGRRRAYTKRKTKLDGINDRYCEFFSNCLTSCCEKMASVFSGCERDSLKGKEELKKDLEKLEGDLKELETYLTNLSNLNQKLESGRKVGKDEMEKLNLPTSDNSMETDRYNIIGK